MGYIPSKFKKKQGSVVAPSTSIKTGKPLKMPEAANTNPNLRGKSKGQTFALKTN